MEAELGARLTPQAQGDDPAADALTAEVVVAALEDAGFQCSQRGTDPPDLPNDLSGALRHYECEVTISDGTYRVGVLSYSDGDEARRVASEANLANRSLRGMRWSALSRGPIVVTVASSNLELVGKLRTILDSVG